MLRLFKFSVYLFIAMGAYLAFLLSADFAGKTVSQKAEAAPTEEAPKNVTNGNGTTDSAKIKYANGEVHAELLPHKAVYKLSLVKGSHGDTIGSISGSISYELKKQCNDWKTVQKTDLVIKYKSGAVFDLKSTENLSESKDGKNYTFSLARTIKNLEELVIEGKAEKNEDGSVFVSFSKPEQKTKLFKKGVVFPLEHTKQVIELAESGKSFFSHKVFSGWIDNNVKKPEDGSAEVSTVIKPIKDDAKLPESKLLQKIGITTDEVPFPVHMASYLNNNKTGQPDMEAAMLMFKNGLIKSIKLDYGSFSVMGNLSELKAVENSECEN